MSAATDRKEASWRPAWVLGGAVLTAMIVLNAGVWWLELSERIDKASITRLEPAFEPLVAFLGPEFTIMSLGLAVAVIVGAIVLSRDRANRIGWILLGITISWLLAWALVDVAVASRTGLLPTNLTARSAAVSAPAVFLFFTLGFVLLAVFPTGHMPGGPWGRVLRASLVVWIAAAVARAFHPGPPFTPLASVAPSFDNPYGLELLRALDARLFIWVVLAMGAVGIASMVARYRSSGSEIRHQIKWVVFALAILTSVGVLAEFVPQRNIFALVATANLTAMLSIGIAVTKYRLYDIDVVISRTFVYGSLAVFIGVVYVGVVVGVGSLIGLGDEPNAVLSIGATALVAVGFQPLRRRLERVANRLVFGRKATPYEVLSEFSHRVAATSNNLLDDAARSLAEGTRADRVGVSVMLAGEVIEAAAWPVESAVTSTEPVSFPIVDGEATLGSLNVFLRAGQQLQDDDRRLAEQLASGMGLALRNQLLTERLEARVEELRESRRRLVAVQDETRRRLERDLHDGAQQQLVALKVKLGLGRAIAEKDGATQTAELLGRLSGEADAAVDAMREFARGVYPPLLEAEGLASAISGQARRFPIPVAVESDGIGRYPREIESTVYFCVLEALRNTVQHAEASQANVSLIQANGSLEFQVTDDGGGFDSSTARGVGLTAMADRLDALTGDLHIHTEPGNGTTLTGAIPVPAPH